MMPYSTASYGAHTHTAHTHTHGTHTRHTHTRAQDERELAAAAAADGASIRREIADAVWGDLITDTAAAALALG